MWTMAAGTCGCALRLLQVWSVVLVFAPTLSGYEWDAEKNTFRVGRMPVFDDYTERDFDATIGQTLLLPCTVRYLGDRVVSWIRTKDLHILTSGPHTFSSDNRFEIVHSDIGDFWGLRIRGVQVSDTGQYECQVNTDPKMSLAIQLKVTVPGVRKFDNPNSKWVGQALIKGPSKVYVRDGSPAIFTCEISLLSLPYQQSETAGLLMTGVRWLHDNKEISGDPETNGIVIQTEYSETMRRLTSVLRIAKVSWPDSGRYTCMKPLVKPDTIKLLVEEGEHSEAMQRDFPLSSHASITYRNKPTLILLLYHIYSIIR